MKTAIIHQSTILIGVALIVTALVIRTAISRRRFNRRVLLACSFSNPFGIGALPPS